jgi:hypothetical protein
MSAPWQSRHPAPIPELHVRTADGRTFRFSQPFHVGRGDDCDVQIDDAHVSRKHALVSFSDGRWSLCDLQSANGVFVGDRRVSTAAIEDSIQVRLGGSGGPLLTLEIDARDLQTARRSMPAPAPPAGGETRMIADYAERYFGEAGGGEAVGQRTRMIRKAFHKIQSKQKRRYAWIIATLALAGALAGGYAYYGHRQMLQQQALAEELFYSMKALDVDIASVELLMAKAGSPQGQEQVKRYLERRRELEANYDTFLSGLSVYGRNLTEEERLILRVTRAFGECELIAPREYLSEVITYIRRWQATGRYTKAVKLAQERGYAKRIAEEFIGHNLPPQFFYLALQESDFDPFTSGPRTAYGFAKGMWQFIPETGARYGLSIGPLAGMPTPDTADDRHDWEKSTVAAAKYIKDIYATDAQASGLLVMASYNWGERRVVNLLKRMPLNPRERNFWKLLEIYREQVPGQTYDYVFSIVSAAVIGENPRLFGFSFDGPLSFLTRQ